VRYGASYTLKQRGRGAFPDVAEAIMTHPDGVMVAALVLGTNDFGRESSSLSWGTKIFYKKCDGVLLIKILSYLYIVIEEHDSDTQAQS
jgi:hypothetical protein